MKRIAYVSSAAILFASAVLLGQGGQAGPPAPVTLAPSTANAAAGRGGRGRGNE